MAYRRKSKKSTKRKSYRKTAPRKRTAARRSSPQTVRIVIEQAAPSLVNDPSVVSAREVKPKKATF